MLLLMIVFVAVSWVVLRITGNYLIQSRVNEEMEQVDSLALSCASLLAGGQTEQLYDLCIDTCRSGGGRMLVLSQSGTVIADSHSLLNGVTVNTAEVDTILRQYVDRAYGFHTLEAGDGQYWAGYFASAVIYNGARIGLVFRSISIGDLVSNLDTLQMTIQMYFFALLVVVIGLGFLISEIISRPINRLQRAMLLSTRGDLSARARVSGNDEIAELAKTFNTMSEKIENLDRTRSRFISNASHELKTPLSAIKVLVETVLGQSDEEMDPAMVRDFLTDVDGEVDRLARIVGDLLTLVQIDSKGVQMRPERLSLGRLAEDTVRRLAPIAKQKSIALSVEVHDEAFVMADPQRFGQVIYNLADNAVKYTPSGGTVTLGVDRTESEALLTVTDNGIGIPQADLPHLFDRFYRVDKARSRATGGTGLGLSIVRETVLLHGGDVSVESEENEGTVFTVTIPIAEDK